MTKLWNALQGKKTYLIALSCIGTVLLQALAEQAQGQTVDWPHVAREVMACLMAMTIRHGVGRPAANPAGPAAPVHPPHPAAAPPSATDTLFDR